MEFLIWGLTIPFKTMTKKIFFLFSLFVLASCGSKKPTVVTDENHAKFQQYFYEGEKSKMAGNFEIALCELSSSGTVAHPTSTRLFSLIDDSKDFRRDPFDTIHGQQTARHIAIL